MIRLSLEDQRAFVEAFSIHPNGVKGGFVIEPLGEPLGAHDHSAFSCGAATLDRYLPEQASQDVKRLVASCFVAVETATNTIAGY